MEAGLVCGAGAISENEFHGMLDFTVVSKKHSQNRGYISYQTQSSSRVSVAEDAVLSASEMPCRRPYRCKIENLPEHQNEGMRQYAYSKRRELSAASVLSL
jgi:hypothetical protein